MKSVSKGVFVGCLAFALNAAATAPVITSQPQSITINNASTANFSVVADNAATYKWLFGTTAIEGATNATLTLDDVATNQEGFYTVVVTSSTGDSTNSQPAQLTIVPGTIVQWTISKYADGGASNFLVQLFDHDKPATVENFIHYITSGSFSNIFFERDVPGFVLQGGDYAAADRATNFLSISSVSTGTNVFPSQVDSEFYVGPMIPNKFGTLAMALVSGEPDSAGRGFFFNLADNSAALDAENGGFTVFGRILSGSNVLSHFNTLGASGDGIFYENQLLPSLPVNYIGTNPPTDANLFFCDFTFVTPPPVDTIPPTVSVTFPAPNALLPPGNPITVTGSASDNVGLAEVVCVLASTTGVNNNESFTNAALGTTNWSLALGILPPGGYQLAAFAQDGAGNLSAPATVYFSNFLQLTIITNVAGQLTTNRQFLLPGPYSVAAEPGAGQVFETWQIQGVISLDPLQNFTLESNVTLTVTYINNTLPAGLAITTPASGSTVPTTNAAEVTIAGSLPSSATVTQVTCQLFSLSNAVTGALRANITGADWSLNVSNLITGPYTIVIVATDSLGREGLATENFTAQVTGPPILSQPGSLTINAGSTAYFSVSASNASSYQWLFGDNAISGATDATLVLDNVATSQTGLYTVLVTSSTGDSSASQPAQLTVLQGTMVQLVFSGYAGGASSNVVLELFDHDKPATVQNFLHYIDVNAYGNAFWSRCVPGFILQGGDFSARNRTNGPSPSVISDLVNIESTFTFAAFNPPFPYQVDNEYGVGPLVPNTFGTIAMQKTPGQPDSAVNAFFFNLADNSSTLDSQDGGYTVFGRIVSGSDVLDYFNTFSAPTILDRVDVSGAPSNCLYNSGQAPLTAVPVNYFGVATPGNSNFFYVDFTLLTPPVIDTNPPTIALVYPVTGAIAPSPDVTVIGTAADDVGLARIFCSIASPGYNGGVPNGQDVIGTTNWSFDFGNLPPGTYSIFAASQDGAGNISTIFVNVTNFVVPQFPAVVNTNGPGKLSINLTATNIVIGSTHAVKAIPAPGALFVNWTDGTNVSINPINTLTIPNGLQLSPTFIANTLPGGISFTSPTANAKLTTTSVALSGKVAASAHSATITARIFSAASGQAVTGPMVVTRSGAWSLPAVQLAPGKYIAQALATNDAGKTTVISEDFSVLAPLNVTVIGPGTTSIASGAYLQTGAKYSIRAIPNRGASFYSWSGPSGISFDPAISFTETNGVALTATFVPGTLPNSLSFTYPRANSQVATNGFLVTGTVSAALNSPQVLCQLFSNMIPVTALQVAAVNGTTWSAPFSNLPQGPYTAMAIASDAAGGQTLISENFKLNLFPNLAGTYYGVFYGTSVVTNNAGFIKLTLNDAGMIYGKLQFPYFTFNLPPYPLDSVGYVELSGRGLYGLPIYFQFYFNLTNGTDSVIGYVYSFGTVSTYTGYRAISQLPTNTVPGKYVLEMATITNQTATGPTNDGFAAYSISQSGALNFGATLADNTTFSEGVGISKDGIWPVYATLYGGQGVLLGWETNVLGPDGTAGSTGTLYWVKNPVRSTYFPSGFNIEAASTATNYAPPATGFPNYTVVFAGGSFNPPQVYTLKVTASGQLVTVTGPPYKLALSISAGGVITGTIYNPSYTKPFPIRGVFTNPAIGGSGFVLDPNGQNDPFQITP